MIKEFLAASTWEDLVQYLVISIVVVALSPYGLFILKSIFALLTGRPMPRVVKRSKGTAQEAVDSVAEAAINQLDRIGERMEDLQQKLAQEQALNAHLQSENEALKEHIRNMESGKEYAHESSEESDCSRNSLNDYDILGLKEPPLPSWEDIRSAYIILVKELHPDHGGNPEKLKVVNAAYARLKARHKPKKSKTK